MAGKELAKAFSYEEISNSIQTAINNNFKTPYNCGYFWIVATYPDSVVINADLDNDNDRDLYQVPYTIDDKGDITLGEPQQVEREFVPVKDDTAKAAEPEGLEK